MNDTYHEAAIVAVARAAGTLYSALVKEGFDRAQAMSLTEAWLVSSIQATALNQ